VNQILKMEYLEVKDYTMKMIDLGPKILIIHLQLDLKVFMNINKTKDKTPSAQFLINMIKHQGTLMALYPQMLYLFIVLQTV